MLLLFLYLLVNVLPWPMPPVMTLFSLSHVVIMDFDYVTL